MIREQWANMNLKLILHELCDIGKRILGSCLDVRTMFVVIMVLTHSCWSSLIAVLLGITRQHSHRTHEHNFIGQEWCFQQYHMKALWLHVIFLKTPLFARSTSLWSRSIS